MDLNLLTARDFCDAAIERSEPWSVLRETDQVDDHDVPVVSVYQSGTDDNGDWGRYVAPEVEREADAEFIAFFDPPTVLAMVDEIEKLRNDCADLADARVSDMLRLDQRNAENDRLTDALIETRRQREELRRENAELMAAHELMVKQFRTMQREKEHGWRPADQYETERDEALIALDCVNMLWQEWRNSSNPVLLAAAGQLKQAGRLVTTEEANRIAAAVKFEKTSMEQS